MNRYSIACSAVDCAWAAYRSAPRHMEAEYFSLWQKCLQERAAALVAMEKETV